MPSQGNYRTQQHTCVSTSLEPRSPHTVNGSFAAPNGLVCELPPEAAEAGLFATFTGSTGKVRCNLGEAAFKHAQPSANFTVFVHFQ